MKCTVCGRDGMAQKAGKLPKHREYRTRQSGKLVRRKRSWCKA